MILLLSAMDTEIRDIGTAMENRRDRSFGPFAAWDGTLDGKPVALAKTGVGKVQAALCTQLLIERLRPDRIIVTGLAGALNPTYEIGDTIIARDTIQHDMDARGLGFELGMVPYTDSRCIPCDPALVALAATYQPKEGALHLGRILTGDQFIDASRRDRLAELRELLDGDAVEMEGAAIAFTAKTWSVPFLLARTISDRADGQASDNFLSFLPRASRNSLGLVRHLLAGI